MGMTSTGDKGRTKAPITIKMVTVRHPGNANDPLTGNVFGGVDHKYQIGKYEVTIHQYAKFLNSVAASDPYALYNPSMGTDVRVAGIRRIGSAGSYQYEVIAPAGDKPAGADSPGNRPITYIDWFDAARFANWMHNGRGSGGTENGAYTLNGATSGNAVAVNPGARYYLPTESEWYKAAYYSPKLKSGAGGYYLYATQSNSAPGNAIGPAPGQANFYADSGTYSLTQSPFLADNQNYLTNVGAFSSSPSFYGTFDQGGNAYEWNDLTGKAGSLRSLRSGFFQSNQGDLTVLDRYVAVPVANFSGSGFRLAAAVGSRAKAAVAREAAGDVGFTPAEDRLYGSRRADRFVGDPLTLLPAGNGASPDRIINFQPSDRIDLPGVWSRKGQPLQLREPSGTVRLGAEGIELLEIQPSAPQGTARTEGTVALVNVETGRSGESVNGIGLLWMTDPAATHHPLVLLSGYGGPVSIV